MSHFALIQGNVTNSRSLHQGLLTAGMVVGRPLILLQLHQTEGVWRPPRTVTAPHGYWAIPAFLNTGQVALNVIVFGDAIVGTSDANEYLVACQGTLSEEDRDRCVELFGIGPDDPVEHVLVKYLQFTRWANGLTNTRPLAMSALAEERYERNLDPIPGLQRSFGTSDFSALVIRCKKPRVDIVTSSHAGRVYASHTGEHLVTSSRVLAETYLGAASVVPLDAAKQHHRFTFTAGVKV